MFQISLSSVLLCLVAQSCGTKTHQKINTALVYDMTEVERGPKFSYICDTSKNGKLAPELLPSGVYRQNGNLTEYFPDNKLMPVTGARSQTIYLFKDQNVTLTTSLIFDKTQFCNVSETSKAYIQKALVLKPSLFPQISCKKFCYYLEQIWPNKTANIKFGLEVDETTFPCLQESCKQILTNSEVLVFNIKLDEINKQLSYAAVTRQIKESNFEAGISTLANTQVYLKIDIEFSNAIDPEKQPVVWYFIRNFTLRWLKSSQNITLIMPYSEEPETVPTNLQNLHPVIMSLSKSKHNCELRDILINAGFYFDKVFVESITANVIEPILSLEKCSRHYQTSTRKPLISVNIAEPDEFDVIISLSTKIGLFSTFPLVVFFSKPSVMDRIYYVSNLQATNNTSGVCFPIIEQVNYTRDSICEHAYQNVVTFRVTSLPQAQLPVFFTDGLKSWNVAFDDSWFTRNWYQQWLPGSHVPVQIHVRLTRDGLHEETQKYLKTNLFCSMVLANIQEFHTSILLWAQMHDFDVITYPLMDTDSQVGFWHNVSTEPALNRTLTDYTVLVKRVLPEILEYTLPKIPFSYPCIHANEKPTGDQFGTNPYSGISLYLNLPRSTPLDKKDVEGLIHIAFSKFPVLEIILKDSNDFDVLSDAINGKLVESLWNQTSKARNLSLYIDSATQNISLDRLIEVFNVKFYQVYLHLSDWKDLGKHLDYMFENIVTKNTRKVELGVKIEDCIGEINDNLTSVKELKYFNFVKHIVCVVEGKPVHNLEEETLSLQMYFDTHLYIHRYVSRFLRLETIFSFNFRELNCTDNSTTEAYLHFLNIANKFAKGHQIKYFLGDAFLNCSWWHVNDYNDLQNHLSYTERISGQNPSKFSETETTISTQNITMVVSVSVVAAVLLSLVLGIWIYDRRRLKKLLTAEEVDAFLNGEEVECQEEAMELHTVQIKTVKKLGFNKEFKVKQKHIEIGELVGKGNFGQVFKGTLYSNQTVAVKIPIPDCSKEEFTTLLAEVKILSYIGVHVNVLRFVGAYVKEIDVGVIYVLTEFCENGTLETFLRKRKPKAISQNIETDESDSDTNYVGYVTKSVITLQTGQTLAESVATTELARFAYEIASGMEYIAEKKVVHSDLSARNVLLNANITCKIGDFGLSRKLYETGAYIKTGDEALPWKWMAIESLKNMEFTTKSDVWSFGVTLWEIFSLGDIPYPGVTFDSNFTQTLEVGLRLSKPEHASESIYETMKNCWVKEPDDRPKFADLRIYFKDFVEPTIVSPG